MQAGAKMEIPRALWRKIQAKETCARSRLRTSKRMPQTRGIAANFIEKWCPDHLSSLCEGIGPRSAQPVKGEKVAKRGSQPLWVRVVRTDKEPGGRKPGLRLA